MIIERRMVDFRRREIALAFSQTVFKEIFQDKEFIETYCYLLESKEDILFGTDSCRAYKEKGVGCVGCGSEFDCARLIFLVLTARFYEKMITFELSDEEEFKKTSLKIFKAKTIKELYRIIENIPELHRHIIYSDYYKAIN